MALYLVGVSGCAEIGNAPESTDTQVDSAMTPPSDTGDNPQDTQATPTDSESEDTKPDPETIEIPVPDIEADEPEIDPNAPWICTDDGFVDPIQEHSCDWTWSCNSGEYVISCTLQGSNYQCLCKIMNSTVGKYWSDELCAAQSTKNLANAVCGWQLPL